MRDSEQDRSSVNFPPDSDFEARGADDRSDDPPGTYFSDVCEVDPETLDQYGAFNVSLVNDLPLFIDPFLLFNSDNPQSREGDEEGEQGWLSSLLRSRGYADHP